MKKFTFFDKEKKLIRFNEHEMLGYFKSFDYLEYKYGPLLDGIEGDEKYRDLLPGLYEYFLSYENDKHHILYNDIDYNEIKRRIELIYSDSDEAENFVFLYDFSLDHLIDRYLNIPSLDKLFSEHYFEYEWRQHTDLDFKRIDLGFYRDHFIHQIRNCFMVMKLLSVTKEGGLFVGKDDGERFYYKKIEDTLKSRHNDISKYACAQVEQYKGHVSGVIDSWEKEEVSSHEKHGAGDEDDIAEIARVMRKNVTEYAWEYLINGSLIVAALFHDLGYPVGFTYKRSKSISEYISLVLPSDNIGFGRLNDLLENSLLFRTVKKDELEKRYNDLDHGALSAFILLLQFYESGAIRELNPIKRGIIELAAVTIYDHTLKYRISGEDKADRARPSFADNPLSYTLRFVDDLQEWNRTYFEIRSSGDLMYCEKCKMPVNHLWDRQNIGRVFGKVREVEESRHAHDVEFKVFFGDESGGSAVGERTDGHEDGSGYEFEYILDGHMGKPYICGCNASKYIDKADSGDIFGEKFWKGVSGGASSAHLSLGLYENGMPFSYQKIIYTETSDEVVAVCSYEKGIVGCAFYIEYDAFKSLCLLSVNQSSLEYRMKELLKINRQFLNQSGIRFKMVAYMTNNPMMLKMRILFDFLYEVGHYVNVDEKYKKNASYFDVLWGKGNGLCPQRDMYDYLSVLGWYLKTFGFIPYCHMDEQAGLTEELPIEKSPDDIELNEVFDVVGGYLDFAVPNLMGGYGTGNGQRNLVENLKHTVRAYLAVMQTALKSDSWNLDEEGYKARFDYPFGRGNSDDVYVKSCGIVFDDMIEQLYCQAFEKGGMDSYYERIDGDGGTMDYAVKILFDKKRYNPRMMRERTVNYDEGSKTCKYKFTFFDVYSDMYLFKEMNRFASDNRRRRMEKYSEKRTSEDKRSI